MEEKEFDRCRKRIIKVLKKAYQTKYYNEILLKSGINSPNKIESIKYSDFVNISYLTKADLNTHKFDMLTEKFCDLNIDYYEKIPYSQKRQYLDKYGLELRVTSGSTGTPIEVLKSKDDIRRDYIVLNHMRRKLTNYDFTGKFLWIWPVNPLTRKYFYPDSSGEKWWKVNNYGIQVMLYEHSDDNFEEIYEFIMKNDIEWITSSPTALVNFANYILKERKRIDNIKYIECHSEYLYDWQADLIYRIFGCAPVSIYSSNEVQFMAAMCNNRKWHICDNSCFLEFVDNEFGTKDVCVTSLNYIDIPIIRYKLGDCGMWSLADDECNLKGVPFELSKFRKNDYIILKNGNRMESFAITDSVVFLCNNYGLKIWKYRVEQNLEDKFTYYFDFSIANKIDEKCKEFLEQYLSILIGYKIKVNIVFMNIEKLTYYGQKFKYFVVNEELQHKYDANNN